MDTYFNSKMNRVPIFILNIGLSIFAATILLYMTENNVSAWHENLGIDATQASELYKSNPNDPQIKQWQNIMMKEYNVIKGCFVGSDIFTPEEVRDFCVPKVIAAYAQCENHPNSLIMCQDPRIKEYAVTQGKGEGFPLFKEEQARQKLLEYEKEQKLVEDCATHAINQTTICDDPKLKSKIHDYQEVLKYEKERIEAQKDNDQKVLTVEEEQQYIEFCAKRVYQSNHLPPVCRDDPDLKEKVEIEVQKLRDNNYNDK